MPRKIRSLKDRFWAKVDKTSSPHGCYLWTGATQKGYGCIQTGTHRKSKLRAAHRLAYEWVRGSIPAGMEVTHNCPGGDNKLCCNPAHLILATHKEHAADTEKKGQYDHPLGTANGKSKMTPAQVSLARKLRRETKMSCRQIAEAIGGNVKGPAVYAVFRGDSWKHLPEISC